MADTPLPSEQTRGEVDGKPAVLSSNHSDHDEEAVLSWTEGDEACMSASPGVSRQLCRLAQLGGRVNVLVLGSKLTEGENRKLPARRSIVSRRETL